MMPLLGKLKDKFSKERFSVGLDIGTSTVKIVKLKFIKGNINLCGFGLELAQADLGALLKKIAQSYNINRVNISVSGPAAIIRYINFPRMQYEELRQALNFEAQKHIPFSVAEVNLDAHILKSDLSNNEMLVLLAAAKKDFINQRLKIIKDAGLNPNIIALDSIALINAFNFNYSKVVDVGHKKAIALLNIGASQTNLNILEDGLPRLSRDIHIAGPASLSNLATEIRVSFDYYESQSALAVAKIFLSGGGSLFPELKDTLANMLDIEVEYWDPFKQINIVAHIDSQKIKAVSAQLAVAVGLALHYLPETQ